MSMEVFLKLLIFHIDTLDACVSDGNCPVCIVFSCKDVVMP